MTVKIAGIMPMVVALPVMTARTAEEAKKLVRELNEQARKEREDKDKAHADRMRELEEECRFAERAASRPRRSAPAATSAFAFYEERERQRLATLAGYTR